MEMTSGRISPTGGRTGHGHPASEIFEPLMRVPSVSVQENINSATTIAGLKAAIQAWITEQ